MGNLLLQTLKNFLQNACKVGKQAICLVYLLSAWPQVLQYSNSPMKAKAYAPKLKMNGLRTV